MSANNNKQKRSLPGSAIPRRQMRMDQGPLGPMIHIDDHPLIKHKAPWLPDGNLIIQTAGICGSGKTRSILQVLPSIANLKQVAVLTLVPGNSTNKAIREWCEDQIGPDSYAEFDNPEGAEQEIQAFTARLNPEGASSGSRDPNEQNWSMIIMDDFMLDDRKSSPYRLCVMGIVRMLRNLHCHSWYLSQAYKDSPPEVRTNANIRFIFRLNSVQNLDYAGRDFSANGFGDQRYFRGCYAEMERGGRFSYMLLVNKPGDPHIYVHKHADGATALMEIPVRNVSLLDMAPSKGDCDDDDDQDEPVKRGRGRPPGRPKAQRSCAPLVQPQMDPEMLALARMLSKASDKKK